MSFFTVFVQLLNCMVFIHCLSFTQYWTLLLIRMHFFLTRNCQGLYWVFHKELFHCSTWKHKNFFSPRVNSRECLPNVLKKMLILENISKLSIPKMKKPSWLSFYLHNFISCYFHLIHIFPQHKNFWKNIQFKVSKTTSEDPVYKFRASERVLVALPHTYTIESIRCLKSMM